MSNLEVSAQKILEVLVKKLPKIRPGHPQTYLGYKEIHDILGLSRQGETFGTSLKNQGLLSLAQWTKDTGKPAITGIIVDRDGFMPGTGYFELFQKTAEDFQWWESEVKRSKAFDWSPFVIEAAPEPPTATDIGTPDRVEVTTYRIIRDTALANRVKKIHDYECQICGLTIFLRDGTRYAEAHHIKPLGNPHNGPDVAENIICVCPNHHAELDFAARDLRSEQIREKHGHSIANEYLEYHNFKLRGATP